MTNKNIGTGKWALPSGFYDTAKDVVTIYLPATSALYVGLAPVWGFPVPDKIAITIALVMTFLGVVLKISTNSYNKSLKSTDGVLQVDQSDPTKDSYMFDISTDLEELAHQDRITLKVYNVTPILSQE